jgi:AcrR family transcriptional regulator
LDAVAHQAGVSKGGLLYHYASRDALIAHLLRQMMRQFEADVLAHQQQESEQPGSLLRAYVRASFAAAAPLFPALGTMLAVSLLENSELAALVQDDARQWQQRLTADALAAGLSATRAHLVRQAADAVWFDQLIGMAPTAGESALLLEDLLTFCQGAAA